MIVLTLALLLLSACATETVKPVELTSTLLMPEVQHKLPVSIAIYYFPGFVNQQERRALPVIEHIVPFTLEERWGPSWVGDVPLGAASVQLFDQAARLAFQQVTSVGGRPPLGEKFSIDGVIEPRIDAFEMQHSAIIGWEKLRLGEWSGEWGYPATARIRYRFDVYDRSGTLITSWIVIGDAAMLMFPKYGSDSVAILVDAALQDAMRQFVQGFSRLPEVVQWLSTKKSQ
jgi:hypothetical protein